MDETPPHARGAATPQAARRFCAGTCALAGASFDECVLALWRQHAEKELLKTLNGAHICAFPDELDRTNHWFEEVGARLPMLAGRRGRAASRR